MLVLRFLLMVLAPVGLAIAAHRLVAARLVHLLQRRAGAMPALDWPGSWKPAFAAILALLVGNALAVVPSGHVGVRVSQVRGVSPRPLPPGVHLMVPFVEEVALYDVRDRVLAAGDPDKKTEPLRGQSREGLTVGLSLNVRYRLEPKYVPYIHVTLPSDIDSQIVAPAVASAFREVLPRYVVRQIFSTRREEMRSRAAKILTGKLGADGIAVEEVMLRDVVLPPEYAKGLESLLLKEQENEQLDYLLQIKEKQVRQAELEAEADKRREVKAAEAAAQVQVLRAKGEADAMKHKLPLKEKQIEQTRLEAEARMAATVKDAEAAAQASVIKGKADAERDRIMADAEANRIRVTSAAELDRMKIEAMVLKDNPLLIQKIVAERLSDKLQIMMVPMDGRNFFASDVFRGVANGFVPEPQNRPVVQASRRR